MSSAHKPQAGRRAVRREAADANAPDAHSTLAAALAVLDRLLAVAVDKTARLLGPATLLDPWRGMHLDADDVRRALNGERVAVLSQGDSTAASADAIAAPIYARDRLANLLREAGLDALDIAITVIAAAPDVDLRYERVYGYLQDDIAARRPAPDLIANLLGESPAGRLRVLERLAPGAPLWRARVVEPAAAAEGPALGRGLRLNAPWLALLTRAAPDAAAEPDDGALPTALPAALNARIERIVREARSGAAPLRLVLQGPDGAGKHALACHVMRAAGLALRVVDVRGCASVDELRSRLDAEAVVSRLDRGVPYLHGIERMAAHDPQLVRALRDTLAEPSRAFVLAVKAPLSSVGAQPLSADRVTLQWPDAEARAVCWDRALAGRGVAAAPGAVASVAARFVLNGAQIRQAAADVERDRRFAARKQSGPAAFAELAAAARCLCGDELGLLAQRIRPIATFDVLVATPEVTAQLRELCQRVAMRDTVRRWCGDGVHRRGSGVNALFAGPSGIGKTFAAEVVAHALELDLFRIDLAAVVSKYIGETEKNLDRVFAAAEYANAVLFFDEAEALFGKRSDVKDAHDRYANIEIAYLLQKIEQFGGVAILATNLKQNLDDAFTRRLTFSINFAFPEEAERLRLWATLWPEAARRADDVDLGALAREHRLSGSSIRNVISAALYGAAAGGAEVVTHEHLLHAVRREFQKFGKTLGPVPAPAVPAAGRQAA